MGTKLNLLGQKFGKLTVLSLADGRPRRWVCHCDCGNQCERRAGALRDGHKAGGNHSCGCAKKESIALAGPISWKKITKFSHPHKQKLKWMRGNMLKRCYKPGARRYERYGGRGITICDEWRNNPTAFFKWAIASGYAPGLWIERKDVDGNYCPENCCFKTPTEQANNTSRNRFLTYNGETLTVSQWARRIGLDPRTMQKRVSQGWELERIFNQPPRGR